MSTYTTSSKFDKIADGGGAGTWGLDTNKNWERADFIAGGFVTYAFADGDEVTLSLSDAWVTTDTAAQTALASRFLKFTRASGDSSNSVILSPNNIQRVMFVWNAKTANDVVLKTSGGSGSGTTVTLVAGEASWIATDGTGAVVKADSFKKVFDGSSVAITTGTITTGTITNATITTLSSAMNANSQAITNVNIDSGTIDGATIATSDVTVGTGKTLDVSDGTLTLKANQITGDKVDTDSVGTTNNVIVKEADETLRYRAIDASVWSAGGFVGSTGSPAAYELATWSSADNITGGLGVIGDGSATGSISIGTDSGAREGTRSVVLGYESGPDLVDVTESVFIGHQTGRGTYAAFGDDTVAVGYRAGGGSKADSVNFGEQQNTAIGSNAIPYAGGEKNTAVGFKALLRLGQTSATGQDSDLNTVVGALAADYLSRGSSNISIGYRAGNGNATGSGNVCIGNDSGDWAGSYGADTLGSNKLVINNGLGVLPATITASTGALVYGDFSAGTMKFNSSHTSNDGLTVNNTNAAYTGDLVKLTTTDAADSGFNFINAEANSALQFKVTGDGIIHAQSTTIIEADYADMFEWSDGNPEAEDRVGISVVVAGDGMVRAAEESDPREDIVGIVSGTACMIGNAAWGAWESKYLKDEFGRTLTESVGEASENVLNPEYDEDREYIPRLSRTEWAVIGLVGRVHLKKGLPTHPSWRKLRDVSEYSEEWLIR